MLLNHPYADFYKLNRRPPQARIAEHPSQHIAKKSRPNSNHWFQDLSYMKSDGVDAWLQHWLTLQKRNKRPLILKDGSDEIHPNPTSSSNGKGKGKASRAQSTTDKWNLSFWPLDLCSVDFGSHSFQKAILMYRPTLLTVHILSLNTSSWAIKLRTSLLGMRKHKCNCHIIIPTFR